jgi:hypothetical protein
MQHTVVTFPMRPPAQLRALTLDHLHCTCQGCGLLKMGSQNEASAAIDGLDDQHTWPGMTNPMVVKWMDGDLQRQRR